MRRLPHPTAPTPTWDSCTLKAFYEIPVRTLSFGTAGDAAVLERAAELNLTDLAALVQSRSHLQGSGLGRSQNRQLEGHAEELEDRAALTTRRRAVADLNLIPVWNQSNLGDQVRKDSTGFDLGSPWVLSSTAGRAGKTAWPRLRLTAGLSPLAPPHPSFPLVAYYKLAMVKVDQRRFAEAILLAREITYDSDRTGRSRGVALSHDGVLLSCDAEEFPKPFPLCGRV